ncbi:MAG: aminotransferase class I/II-fold pyridoxal phosphate-dependent enzyme [Oscillospiraceae bacterium]|jgi:arginine/lysine/ornithine decarboxylase|nr:aminotransferase class I/II-fold pyridoxal phosphate-dependent enzyme [Oscillospiraceae bacterium]
MLNLGLLPMHMPGHKRRAAPFGGALPDGVARAFEIDITEISGADDLHDMKGRLLETASLAARLYGAKAAFPMVNGATGGILAAVRAAARGRDGSAVMPRASHRSVYNAAELCGLEPVVVPPERVYPGGISGGTSPEDVRRALASAPNARCVVITSPTYEGIVSDVGAIADIAHARGLPLIADAAHGAHFGFSGAFPENASRLGADIEIVSLHKTLPALTQTALALVSGDIVGAGELERELRVFETSSPSYVLMESITACLKLLAARGAELFALYAGNLEWLYSELRGLSRLRLPDRDGARGFDMGKLVVGTDSADMSGPALCRALRESFGIELEMAAPGYALAMTSIFDTRDTLGRLAAALTAIDKSAGRGDKTSPARRDVPERAMSVRQARETRGERVRFPEAEGLAALEYVWAYPPGIPIIVPGEIIDGAAITAARELYDAGIEPRSDSGELPYIAAARA